MRREFARIQLQLASAEEQISTFSAALGSMQLEAGLAVRELWEELGVKSAVARLQKFAACDDTSHEFTVLYRCFSDAAVTPDPEEIAAIQWMTLDAIQAWMTESPDDFSPAFRLLFGWYLARD